MPKKFKSQNFWKTFSFAKKFSSVSGKFEASSTQEHDFFSSFIFEQNNFYSLSSFFLKGYSWVDFLLLFVVCKIRFCIISLLTSLGQQQHENVFQRVLNPDLVVFW